MEQVAGLVRAQEKGDSWLARKTFAGGKTHATLKGD